MSRIKLMPKIINFKKQSKSKTFIYLCMFQFEKDMNEIRG